MNRLLPPQSIAVIGAGWAGLAAALYLAERGAKVEVFEAAPQAGGRARRLDLEVEQRRFVLDNGQHLLIGAYRDTLRIIVELGCAGRLQHLPMQLNSVNGLRLKTSRLPAPLHLLSGLFTCQGLSVGARVSMLGFMIKLRVNGWKTVETTVSGLLQKARQSPELVKAIWQPLCVATMNTDIDLACAQTFVNVLRDTLGASRADSDFVVSLVSLGDLFALPAVARLEQQNRPVHLRQPVRELTSVPDGWKLRGPATDAVFDQVILAVPPTNAGELLSDLPAAGELRAALARFAYEPIATTYLWWDETAFNASGVVLPAWIQLDESQADQYFGQWCFDRGVQHGHRIAGVVISAAARALLRGSDLQSDRERIGRGISAQVASQMGLPTVKMHRTVVEKRATIRCTADRPKLTVNALADLHPGLWLAGDYVWHEYPATLEGAVRSGEAAAQACLQYRRPGR